MFSQIYAITPDKQIDIQKINAVLIKYNISILQYRRKNCDFNIKLLEAKKLAKLCDSLNVNLIINDDIKLAKIIGCGVHLGKDDGSVKLAKKELGSNAIIGVSCYNDINLSKKYQNQGVSYCGFGSVFSSSTKPNAPKCNLEIIKKASLELKIPIVGIGGINFENMDLVLKNGATSVAMIDALWD
jgi:thiamine-phosphate pyrophosphorylase